MTVRGASARVRQALQGHAWIGLLTGACLYLVCLSGTLAVFYPDFERWEQPQVHERTQVDPAAVEAAWNQWIARGEALTHHMFISLPTAEIPRASIASQDHGWFLGAAGDFGPAIRHDWTHLLLDLHLYLHLPHSVGMIVVSALGALLCSLVLSGVIAHPRIFRDAFLLRTGGSRHLEQADLHNRLSVWGLPFHLMMGITGAYFGLAAIVSAAFALAWYEGDRDKVAAIAFGGEYRLGQPDQPLAIAHALATLHEIAPSAQPASITVEAADDPARRYLVIGARHPGRLIWSEQYAFDAAGRYLGKAGFSDGETGRQALWSVYRLHFGHYGGIGIRLLYVALGLALTVVSVTGINIWLVRTPRDPRLQPLWTGLVWGAPLALVATALLQVLLAMPALPVFWLVVGASMLLALRLGDAGKTTMWLQLTTASALLLLVAGHTLTFRGAALQPHPLAVNGGLLLCAAALVWRVARHRCEGRLSRHGSALHSPNPAGTEALKHSPRVTR